MAVAQRSPQVFGRSRRSSILVPHLLPLSDPSPPRAHACVVSLVEPAGCGASACSSLASPWPCLNVTSAETRGRACSRPTVVARPPLAVEQLGARGRPRHRSEQRIIAPPSRAFDRRCSCSCRLKSGGRQKFLSHGVFSPDFPSSPTHFVCLSLSHTHFVD